MTTEWINSPEVPAEFEEQPVALASRIASKFAVPTPLEAFDFPEKGNINRHTYLISAGRRPSREFLLQQINQHVFRRPAKVMASMIACIDAQRRNLSASPTAMQAGWETIELVPARQRGFYVEDRCIRGRSFWRLMKRIPGCLTYKSLGEIGERTEQLRISQEAGKGLAIFADLTADMEIAGLENPLPGYRETRIYFEQLESVLASSRSDADAAPWLPEPPLLRESTGFHFLVHLPEKEYRRRLEMPDVRKAVELALDNRAFALTLLNGMDNGEIRRVAVHGDTKLDNFLFSTSTGRVKALVDLDTIMPHTWLADWGDMVRSLCNVAGEKEPDQNKIQVDSGIFGAIARGFLGTTVTVPPEETSLMVDAVKIIALELGIRFLTDYIRGDTYFSVGQADPPDLNRIRGLGQLRLFQRLCESEAGLQQAILRECPR